MKKKTKIIIGIITIVFVSAAVWWFSPKYFLKHVNPQVIASIDVFNGNDGNGFTITNQEDIEFLTEHIQSVPMKKEEISIGMGYTYRVTFLNEKGKKIDEFIIMGPSTIKQGAIFYRCNGELKETKDYLIELERVEFPDTDWIKGQENQTLADLVPMIMVDGKIYLDSGTESSIEGRCGTFDGEITSTVDQNEMPTTDNQSNFGVGYGYQCGPEGTIEVNIDGKWWVFVPESE